MHRVGTGPRSEMMLKDGVPGPGAYFDDRKQSDKEREREKKQPVNYFQSGFWIINIDLEIKTSWTKYSRQTSP